MYSGSFRSPRPANWAQIESDRMDALLTRSFPTSTTHNAGGGRRVLLDEGEDVEHKALPQTLKPDEARHSHSKSPHVPTAALTLPPCLCTGGERSASKAPLIAAGGDSEGDRPFHA